MKFSLAIAISALILCGANSLAAQQSSQNQTPSSKSQALDVPEVSIYRQKIGAVHQDVLKVDTQRLNETSDPTCYYSRSALSRRESLA